jgi:RNA polymerase sigma-70 factor (ECF subfamily)
MPTDLSDEDLALRYRDGDLAAFEELYRRHSGGLYRFIAWRSPRREWVDEIVQDSWAALHQARGRYVASASFRTFLYQIARNRLIDLLRHDPRLVLASDIGSGEGAFQQLADGHAADPAPDEALDARRQAGRLHAAIRALPDEQREALVLQQFSGLALDEIAVLCGVPQETVKSRLRYAMHKLRAQLANEAAKEAGA